MMFSNMINTKLKCNKMELRREFWLKKCILTEIYDRPTCFSVNKIVHELLPRSFTVHIFRLTIVHEPVFPINRIVPLREKIKYG